MDNRSDRSAHLAERDNDLVQRFDAFEQAEYAERAQHAQPVYEQVDTHCASKGRQGRALHVSCAGARTIWADR